ncbi:unnamed protein product [Rhodiola kirilowii]
MSTVVYQGLQSHLESQMMMETKTLKLKLSSVPKLLFSQSLEMALQSLVIVPSDCDSKKPAADIPISPPSSYTVLFPTHPPCEKLHYVHPSANKHSSLSLHLCTENLGSETGSEFIENSIFSSSELFKIIPAVKKEQTRNRRQVCEQPKTKQFPPPLTTLYGSDSLHLRPYREDGRVILKATRAPISRGCCFQVDRSNGRVRLSLADSTMHIVCGGSKQ